ncbi:flagellar hook-length control protein FliK [Novosphingobium panipatense]|uniref:flagellar hook-length control protein FliK n=1 Tax=Novosphingobium TaxID=165696 RepID=UPI000CDAD3FC|nr:flagellar hook-length control protein FliK [Novosphingobium sp. HII-3]
MALTPFPFPVSTAVLTGPMPASASAAGAQPGVLFAAVLEAVSGGGMPDGAVAVSPLPGVAEAPQGTAARDEGVSRSSVPGALLMKAAETVSAVSVRSVTDPVISIPRPPQVGEQADGSLRVDMAPVAVDAEAGSVPAVGPEGSSGDAPAFLAAPFADAAVSEPEPLPAVQAPALTPEDPQASPASQEEEPRATPAVAIDLPLQPPLVFPGEDGVSKGAEAAGTTDLVAESPEVRATTNEDAVAIHTEDQDSAASPAASALPVAVVIPAIERPVTGAQSERAIQIQPSAVSHERSATDPASVPRDAPDALAPASPDLAVSEGARAGTAADGPSFDQHINAVLERSSSAASPAMARPPASHGAEATVALREGRFGNDIGVAIARAVDRVDRGAGEILLIRLAPQHLGRVDVELSFSEDGTLRAVVSSDNAMALDLMKRESGQLDRALADAGVRADTQSLRFESGAGGQQRHGARPHVPTSPAGDGGVYPDQQEIAAPILPSLRGSGQVDLMA